LFFSQTGKILTKNFNKHFPCLENSSSSFWFFKELLLKIEKLFCSPIKKINSFLKKRKKGRKNTSFHLHLFYPLRFFLLIMKIAARMITVVMVVNPGVSIF